MDKLSYIMINIKKFFIKIKYSEKNLFYLESKNTIINLYTREH